MKTLKLSFQQLRIDPIKIGLINIHRIELDPTIQSLTITSARPPSNTFTATRTFIPKANVLNLLHIQISGINNRKEEFQDHIYSCCAIGATKNEIDVAKKASVLVGTTNNGGKVFNVSKTISNSIWIIDSCDIDHMFFLFQTSHTSQIIHVKNCLYYQQYHNPSYWGTSH